MFFTLCLPNHFNESSHKNSKLSEKRVVFLEKNPFKKKVGGEVGLLEDAKRTRGRGVGVEEFPGRQVWHFIKKRLATKPSLFKWSWPRSDKLT